MTMSGTIIHSVSILITFLIYSYTGGMKIIMDIGNSNILESLKSGTMVTISLVVLALVVYITITLLISFAICVEDFIVRTGQKKSEHE